MLEQDAIPGSADVEDLRGVKGSQIHGDMATQVGQSLVASFTPDSAAMVVDGDGVDPAYDHRLVPELIDLLPSLQPGGLREILGVVHGGPARAQQAHGLYESRQYACPKSS